MIRGDDEHLPWNVDGVHKHLRCVDRQKAAVEVNPTHMAATVHTIDTIMVEFLRVTQKASVTFVGNTDAALITLSRRVAV